LPRFYQRMNSWFLSLCAVYINEGDSWKIKFMLSAQFICVFVCGGPAPVAWITRAIYALSLAAASAGVFIAHVGKERKREGSCEQRRL
jgi:hypothetical protein